MVKDEWNAFMRVMKIPPKGSGILNNLTFAVKDVFEIENHTNTAGNPDWLRTHRAAGKTAPIIDTLLKQGATFQGVTHTDELMYSLNGENFHYGTPVNPKANNRIPGGSSSGSAVCVAAGLTDFAIGTDTGGSVRIPSAYCGVFGIRPTHGIVSVEGVIPLAKSFDTVGWMTRDAELLLRIGKILFAQIGEDEQSFRHLYFPREAWELVDSEAKMTLLKATDKLAERTETKQLVDITSQGLSDWAEIFRIIQGIEIWQEHGEWIQKENPVFGPGIAERFRWAASLNRKELKPKNKLKMKIREHLSELLGDDGVLVIPTAPGEAPLRNLPVESMEQYRSKVMKLTCIAGLTGFPQVTIPVMKENGLPVGLSVIANAGQDLRLLNFVNQFRQIG